MQFPFGFGLSYTTFDYTNMTVDKSNFTSDDIIRVSVDVTNIGEVEGKESVLLFSSDMVASLSPDVRRLRGFDKVSLKPGKTQTVTIDIKGEDLAFVNEMGKWTLEEGEFMLQLGDQTVNINCTTTKVWETPNK